ncbi:putative ribonuclease H-like domain-containing protein [Tanacetum coccineum]|uniref:Ribonuclease H-like domain-containing protein n=1 Tax=Tanacetum coccineum TaxID=301880 RepID=A0ABQ5GPH0_9ASTR
MVENSVDNKGGEVTGQREIRPVWNNAQRVNHQNKFTHPHPKRNFVLTTVVTKSGQVPVNTAKQSSPRAATSISTARPVNTAAPKSKVNDALPKTYSYFKAHSPVRRAFNQKSAAKTNNFNEKVKTTRVNNVTTAGPKAVVSAAVGNGENAVKSSACWIWRPTGNVIDHTSKDSGSYMLKRSGTMFVYKEDLKSDQGIFDSGCSRHMTGNKSFLTDYQEVDGGFVAFAGSPKGGIKDNVDAIRTQQYILLPLLYDSPRSSNDAVADDAAALDNLLVQQKEGYANSTNRDSTVSPSVSAARQSFTNADDLPTDPLMPDLEDTADLLNTSIFSGAYDDEDVGAEADLNNLETTMNVSPIPTTRIHKDHPKDQIIRDINLATQTRRMTKISEELAMMDVKSAFLYGTIEEEVYVCQPPSFEDPQFPDKVYKVEKALYGLHQAPRAWYETLSTYLLENGYRRGELPFFLGLQVQQKEDGIFISQDKYVADILKKIDFTTVKAANTPIETNKALNKDKEVEDVDVYLYRSMIGSLMYLTAFRPDIMFVVCACARDSPFDLKAFSDSDYAGAILDRKSTTGGCQFLGKRLISWQCKKQTIVANSTIKAEYVAIANCCRQVLWIQNQMLDYGFNLMNTKIYIANESTICIVTKSSVFTLKTKPYRLRHNLSGPSYKKKLIQVIKIHTDHNIALIIL